MNTMYQGQQGFFEYYRPEVNGSEEKVFRVSAAEEKDPMKMLPQGPKRESTYQHQSYVWTDLDEEEAERLVINGGSLLVLGVAGTGKSYFVSKLRESLKNLGKSVDAISKTHCASERIGGVTADHYVRRHVLHGICTADAIWIDEISQLEHSLWCELNKLKKQFLLSGDFNQFGPIFDSHRGTEIPKDAFEKSRFLHLMAGGNRLILTECRRSETQLFNFYSSLIHGGSRWFTPLAEVLQKAKEQFHFSGSARHNLVISHIKRVKINRELNNYSRPEVARYVPQKAEKGQLCKAQSLWIWAGLELLGCSQASKKGIRNNVIYVVQSWDEEQVVVQRKGKEEQITLTYPQMSLLRLSYAQTYASCQGTEFDEPLRLHDTENKNFTKKHLFVALSRAKRSDMIDLV